MKKFMSLNINSVRSRMENIIPFLKAQSPDIVGFQEIKVENHIFPKAEFEALGYQLYINGQKSYHGVATLVKEPAVQVDYDFVGQKDQKRMIITTHKNGLVVCNGYFPQGENREHSQKFPYKQNFYNEFLDYLETNFDLAKDKVLIMGDLNIAPEDIDIGIGEQNRKRWLQTGKCSFLPEERAYIKKLKELGFFDTFRQLHPEVQDRFSWFDYRSRGFETEPKRGLRIDHIWVTKTLMDLCKSAEIDYNLRSSNRPSDHCAIFTQIDI
jgi:exodeoxyribonuclease-3